ncbi:MAG TPA: hypothetical protein DC063_06880 [Arenimonas sp.]|nr:hypothetical protein [Arenimonas sp.]
MTAPRYVPILESIVADQTMAAALFQSYSRLLAAAWRQNYQRTDPLDFETEIVPLLGLSRTQAREHLRLLRFGKFIQWTTNGAGRYLISFPNTHTYTDTTPSAPAPDRGVRDSGKPDLPERESGKPDSVVVVLNTKPEPLSNTTTRSGIPENRTRTEALLVCFGVWPEPAHAIAEQIAENEARNEYGNRLPDLRHVLAWIKYVCDPENEIHAPQALAVANLRHNTPAPEAYLPPLICRACDRVEAVCACPQPQLYLPPIFDARATRVKDGFDFDHDRWGLCLRCHRFACDGLRCQVATVGDAVS